MEVTTDYADHELVQRMPFICAMDAGLLRNPNTSALCLAVMEEAAAAVKDGAAVANADEQIRVLGTEGMPWAPHSPRAVPIYVLRALSWERVAARCQRHASQANDCEALFMRIYAGDPAQWSPEDEICLLALYAHLGTSWSQVGRLLSGRTELKAKNRFYSAVRRVMRVASASKPAAMRLITKEYTRGAEILEALQDGNSTAAAVALAFPTMLARVELTHEGVHSLPVIGAGRTRVQIAHRVKRRCQQATTSPSAAGSQRTPMYSGQATPSVAGTSSSKGMPDLSGGSVHFSGATAQRSPAPLHPGPYRGPVGGMGERQAGRRRTFDEMSTGSGMSGMSDGVGVAASDHSTDSMIALTSGQPHGDVVPAFQALQLEPDVLRRRRMRIGSPRDAANGGPHAQYVPVVPGRHHLAGHPAHPGHPHHHHHHPGGLPPVGTTGAVGHMPSAAAGMHPWQAQAASYHAMLQWQSHNAQQAHHAAMAAAAAAGGHMPGAMAGGAPPVHTGYMPPMHGAYGSALASAGQQVLSGSHGGYASMEGTRDSLMLSRDQHEVPETSSAGIPVVAAGSSAMQLAPGMIPASQHMVSTSTSAMPYLHYSQPAAAPQSSPAPGTLGSSCSDFDSRFNSPFFGHAWGSGDGKQATSPHHPSGQQQQQQYVFTSQMGSAPGLLLPAMAGPGQQLNMDALLSAGSSGAGSAGRMTLNPSSSMPGSLPSLTSMLNSSLHGKPTESMASMSFVDAEHGSMLVSADSVLARTASQAPPASESMPAPARRAAESPSKPPAGSPSIGRNPSSTSPGGQMSVGSVGPRASPTGTPPLARGSAGRALLNKHRRAQSGASDVTAGPLHAHGSPDMGARPGPGSRLSESPGLNALASMALADSLAGSQSPGRLPGFAPDAFGSSSTAAVSL